MPGVMSRVIITKVLLIFAMFAGLTVKVHAQETSHLQFVTEYIRELRQDGAPSFTGK